MTQIDKYMRSGKDCEIDMMSLYHALVANKIECKMRLHPAFEREKQVKDLIGYYPAGENQIIVEKDGNTYSIIRGAVSFGDYEIMKISGEGKKFGEPERFETPESLIESLK